MISFNRDKIGVCTSTLCAIHCSLLPVIMFYTGSLGAFAFLENKVTEVLILVFAIAVGFSSLVPAYRKHRQAYVIVLFISGLFLIINAEFVPAIWSGLALSAGGGVMMAYAHFENLKLRSAGK